MRAWLLVFMGHGEKNDFDSGGGGGKLHAVFGTRAASGRLPACPAVMNYIGSTAGQKVTLICGTLDLVEQST